MPTHDSDDNSEETEAETPEDSGGTIDDPLTRSGQEAPSTEFRGRRPE